VPRLRCVIVKKKTIRVNKSVKITKKSDIDKSAKITKRLINPMLPSSWSAVVPHSLFFKLNPLIVRWSNSVMRVLEC
jgi:hypothetical protein